MNYLIDWSIGAGVILGVVLFCIIVGKIFTRPVDTLDAFLNGLLGSLFIFGTIVFVWILGHAIRYRGK